MEAEPIEAACITHRSWYMSGFRACKERCVSPVLPVWHAARGNRVVQVFEFLTCPAAPRLPGHVPMQHVKHPQYR